MNFQPFLYGRAVKGEYFTDREKETQKLKANFQHGINTILISPRRIGKTSLVKKVCRQLQGEDNIKIVFFDIFKCRNEEEFFQLFSENILRQTSSKIEEWINGAREYLTRLSPRINISPDPGSSVSLGFELIPTREFSEDILNLPQKIADKKNCRIIICIDEFQQIGEFRDSITFQKLLRTYWQHQENVTYCLFGSKKHMMNELFEKSSNPFYKFGDVINLKKIPQFEWVSFIMKRFTETGKLISEKTAEEICKFTDNYSSYVQQLSLTFWNIYNGEDEEKCLQQAYNELLEHCGALFEQQTINLTAFQMNFLKALVDGESENLNKAQVINKYGLGTTSNVQRIKSSLLKKELIEIENRRYVIADPILKEWLRRLFYT